MLKSKKKSSLLDKDNHGTLVICLNSICILFSFFSLSVPRLKKITVSLKHEQDLNIGEQGIEQMLQLMMKHNEAVIYVLCLVLSVNQEPRIKILYQIGL